ncbi:unnamed protein product [Didymodactylos carnosus]|uniref:Uncharacterized protein n=1 Tax=Didymodactylos carnosus TaxID=1234261 RepID=A0A815GCN7_9BILA|nr:unnamed protein product [Didymodactylos carnosus]CAF1337889.1 unnamed protein product [Didymodactylos carnosus]CAF4060171.1 unnamed protein product [Didymodactylos carnosus]CAF4196653.1 unnamed protein product [Didymodactylos carnosus]
MGCTGTKNEIKHESNLIDKKHQDNEEIITDGFRKWLKSNRPRADDYVLKEILLSQPNSTQTIESIENDYRLIVSKSLDLISNRNDIKSITKLTKVLQKEITTASPKKVNQTVDILKQTADKLRDGKIVLDADEKQTNMVNGGVVTNTTTKNESLDQTNVQSSSQLRGFSNTSTEPGIGLREALEKARIYFYKGKQAAIFVNYLGGYDVKVIDDTDDALNHDGNLLRSIVVTEVKMRPKTTTANLEQQQHTIPDEQGINEDFRRSIDAALAGLQQIYHKPSTTDSTEHQTTNRCSIPVSIVSSNRPESPIVQQTTSHEKVISAALDHSNLQHGMANTNDKNTLSHPSSKDDLAPYLTTTSIEDLISNNRANIDKTDEAIYRDLCTIVKKSTSTDTTDDQPHDGFQHLADIVRQIAESQNQLNQHITASNAQIFMPPPIDIQPRIVNMIDNVNELMIDSIESTTKAEIGEPILPQKYDTVEKLVLIAQQQKSSHTNIERIVQELKEHGENTHHSLLSSQEHPNIEYIVRELKEHSEKMLHADGKLANYPVDITSKPIASISSKKEYANLCYENRPKSFISDDKLSSDDRTNHHSLDKQMSESYLDDMTHLTRVGISNPTLPTSKPTSPTKINEEKDEQQPVVSTSINSIIEEESELNKPIAHVTQGESKRSQNVTYTETITSQNNGEKSSRTITESYDEPLDNDKNTDQTTTLKVVTKSEFSRPKSGESIMEQAVQVITVKVRNETTVNNENDDIDYERRPVNEIVKNFEQET